MSNDAVALNTRWAKKAMTPTVEAYHTRIRALVGERLAASGASWEAAAGDPASALTAADFTAIEKELLDTGYRFEMSARISYAETPEKYHAPVGIADTGDITRDADGNRIVGTGANVFRVAADVVGTARLISTVETVLDMLTNGVGADTIAIIDDSGGTLTAPILEQFAGVVCLGGTVRSHLGILTREYKVPCLMDARLDGLRDGQRVKVQYSKPPADIYAEADPAARALVVTLEGSTDAH